MSPHIGVGVIGAGEAAQTIHLPVIGQLSTLFRVAGVFDIDGDRARRVAAGVGARAHATLDDLLDDTSVEVVVICSPPDHHARHVVAACAAGKRAVLCEKPLAHDTGDATRIQITVDRSGVPLILGTMHRWDPAVRAAWKQAIDVCAEARIVRSTIYLPPNDVYVGLAADSVTRSSTGREPRAHEWTVKDMILGLATHDLPLIRQIIPDISQVAFARKLAPWGYQISASSAEQCLQLTAMMLGKWPPLWTLRAETSTTQLQIDFPPSYVLAGSARVDLTRGSMTQRWTSPVSGYEAQWQHLADVVAGKVEPEVSASCLVADLDYALELADAAQSYMDRNGRRA